MADSFIFYRSFFKAINRMTKEQAGEAIMKLASYALDGEELPENDPLVDNFIDMAIPLIDANSKRRTDGSKGGRPKKEDKKPVVSENEEDKKPVVSKNGEIKKPNANVNVNVNDNVNQKKELTLQKKAAADSVGEAVDLWNSMNIPEIDEHVEVKKGSKRFRVLSNLLAVHGIEKYREAIAKVKQSEFLRGHGKQGWVIKFNWMIQPENFGNILSGAYDRCSAPNSKSVGTKFNNFPEREHGADYFAELEKAKLGSLGIVSTIGASV